jgi:hypothetical protein
MGLNVTRMAETIWSIIAIIGGVLVVAAILYFLVTGAGDREKDEAARRYFDEHGHWPDESPSR